MSLLSPGAIVILLVAVLSSIGLVFSRVEKPEGQMFWTFSRNHAALYNPIAEAWNAEASSPPQRVNILLISGDALQRRLLSGFLSGTPVPDLVEVHQNIAAQTFKGPLEDVGFVDLTERLEAEGLMDRINRPAFSPWTSRGRIFGLPHDVHPVLLAYRADLVEAAGIDVAELDTWDDFVRIMRPLMTDADGDGHPDRYLLNLWETNSELIRVLMLQAGGGLFDADDRLTIGTQVNAGVLATIVSWTTGPGRIAVNAPEFDAAGNRMRIDGTVLCSVMPDWLTGAWMQDLGQLSGKVKLMPLPAWEPGGLRTSVMGGTMLGIPKRCSDFEAAWKFARHLYFSRELAHGLFNVSGIISPIKEYWVDPIYRQPNPYWSGQANGMLYIEQAPNVPARSSSPYVTLAMSKVGDAAMALKAYAKQEQVFDKEALRPKALQLLGEAERLVQEQIDRNVFLNHGEEN